MKFSPLFVAAALLSMRDVPNDHPPGPPNDYIDGGAVHAAQTEPQASPVDLGDIAPDFSYQAADGRWQHLHDLLAQGPTLLVFGPTDVVLRAIERDRERLYDMGVVPVAVLDVRNGAARTTVEQLGLRYVVLADSRGVIAAQFNAVDGRTGREIPSLFVLDRKRRVRALMRTSLPARGYVSLAANALGIPEPGTPAATSSSPR
ncbi:MAG: redoxin domain-containing protein [Candidatus Eisenbacteria bacterium]|uniref:Redoxin domain-containing protein n=1 Tax=Eiseniibacteriota bacterium TaxID=2212470 RepID=A0A9D6QJ53_UNCEI|nr:redoxin domain-containing protein [Candidatus Eisenbacteria bacterium]MBI3538865.1 redoxin domain-containing protein [Candidatus Eisenbacteria bacterium]